MKYIFTILMFSATVLAHPLKPGFYYGHGDMACNFLDGEILRPDTLTWRFEKLSDLPTKFEMSGHFAIINSVPLHFTAEEISPNFFELRNETGSKSGTLSCEGETCQIEYAFLTNAVGTTKAPQTLKAKWTFDTKGFKQVGILDSNPALLNCRFSNRLDDVGL